MKKQIKELINNVKKSFPLLPKPKYTLSDSVVAADYGDNSNSFEENWRTWLDIKDAQVEQADSLFIFLPARDCQYYLPRYIIHFLEGIELKRYDRCDDFLIYYLFKINPHNNKEYSFSSNQKELISEFMNFLSKEYTNLVENTKKSILEDY